MTRYVGLGLVRTSSMQECVGYRGAYYDSIVHVVYVSDLTDHFSYEIKHHLNII